MMDYDVALEEVVNEYGVDYDEDINFDCSFYVDADDDIQETIRFPIFLLF